MKNGVFLRVLGWAILALAIFAVGAIGSFAHGATTDLAVTYVPKDGVAEDIYVPVDFVIPGGKEPKRVRKLMADLQQEVAPHLVPMPVGYSREHLAKCEVMVLQNRKTPNFRVECGSVPLWFGDKGLRPPVSVLQTPLEVGVVLRSFSRQHFERVRDSIIRQTVKHSTLGT